MTPRIEWNRLPRIKSRVFIRATPVHLAAEVEGTGVRRTYKEEVFFPAVTVVVRTLALADELRDVTV